MIACAPRVRLFVFSFGAFLIMILSVLLPASAQDVPLRPGEAFVTRFSGTTMAPGPASNTTVMIDISGTVGSIIDVRNPGEPPKGEHWIDEPQRKPVTVMVWMASAPGIWCAKVSRHLIHRGSHPRCLLSPLVLI
jgi:hypothetical protein